MYSSNYVKSECTSTNSDQLTLVESDDCLAATDSEPDEMKDDFTFKQSPSTFNSNFTILSEPRSDFSLSTATLSSSSSNSFVNNNCSSSKASTLNSPILAQNSPNSKPFKKCSYLNTPDFLDTGPDFNLTSNILPLSYECGSPLRMQQIFSPPPTTTQIRDVAISSPESTLSSINESFFPPTPDLQLPVIPSTRELPINFNLCLKDQNPEPNLTDSCQNHAKDQGLSNSICGLLNSLVQEKQMLHSYNFPQRKINFNMGYTMSKCDNTKNTNISEVCQPEVEKPFSRVSKFDVFNFNTYQNFATYPCEMDLKQFLDSVTQSSF
ncbi:hypothetical protein HK099_007469 [Clydaea vesicula]|uniref:Uncharacterized protein n=1 Tax=Clydaea vesicula TaxID=447962 RepID=A0AAD5TWW0_9FUNG|nr:hypothetical protein HK099_007469 [Clydaea vesicula]